MNDIIVKKLSTLIELMKIEMNLIYDVASKTANMYRIDALEKNTKYIKHMKYQIKSTDDVNTIKGFGKGTINRISEILRTKDLKEIKYLKYKLKKLYLLHQLTEELSTVIGIGSITALNLINTYDIKSLKDLKTRVLNNSIDVNDKIKLGLKYEGHFEKVIKRKYITKIYDIIKDHLSIFSMVCGSYRRGKELSHDIDLLLCDDKLITLDDVKQSDRLFKIIKKLKKHNIITDDITSETVKTKYMGFVTYKNKVYRIDIRLVPKESLYTAITYFTGSFEHNIKMRNKAKKLAYKLSEYGIFNIMGKMVPISSEKEVFSTLRMPYLEPWER
jgi:DNA polymerase/3'-5' exonuclease PolX